MNQPPETDRDKALGNIAKELKIIRWLLTALLIGLTAVLLNRQLGELAAIIAIVGLLIWLLIIVAISIFSRAKRDREEEIRFRELSGR